MAFAQKLILTLIWAFAILLGCKDLSKQYALAQRESYNCQLEFQALQNKVFADAIRSMQEPPKESTDLRS